jgi:putative ABC transport system permease protein
MFSNYFTIAYRSLLGDKICTLINILGLSIGLTTCFLIYSWVRFEVSYDRHFPESDNIYRVNTFWHSSPDDGFATTYPMVRTSVLNQLSGIETSARLFNAGFLGSKTKVTYRDKVLTNARLYYGDSTFFEVFPLKIKHGNSHHALNRPNTVAITEKYAAILFKTEDPLGKVVKIGSREFEVTAVIEEIPSNTHFHFDVLVSMQSHPWIAEAESIVWSGISFHTYVRIKNGTQPALLEKDMQKILNNFSDDPQGNGKDLCLSLQPIQSIHLTSDLEYELESNGSDSLVYLFITIAVLVLIVAIVNYINLTTARYTQRFKEVGVRKVMGASRTQLIAQFMTESMIVSCIAFLVSLLLIECASPVLYSITDPKYFSITPYAWESLAGFGMVISLITLACGLFPALALSSIKPVRLFKPTIGSSLGNVSLRKALVVFQFVVSITLTICTLITYEQVEFVNDQQLGYNKEQVVALNIGFGEITKKLDLLKSRLQSLSQVSGVTAVSQLPTNVQTIENIDVPGKDPLVVTYLSVDTDFFKVMGIELLTNQDQLAVVVPHDTIHHFVLNEYTASSLGWDAGTSVGKQMSIRHGNQKPGRIVGIAKNFHFQSLHHPMSPLVIEFTPSDYEFLLIKINEQTSRQVIDQISKVWSELAQGIPFDFTFLDEKYAAMYKQEQLTSKLFMSFSGIALLIALLGLFGLSSFAVVRRTKEIGIRKVLGAKMSHIFLLLNKDFGNLLLVAIIVSVPVAIYFKTEWLSGFAYQASIGVEIFIIALLINLLLAAFTIGYHCVQASFINPVEALKNE